MPLVPRKAEIKQVVEVLEDPGYESADAMARALLKLTYRLLQERDWWVAGWQESNPRENGVRWNHLYGPFASHTDAYKALLIGVAVGPDGVQRGIFKVNGIAAAEDLLAALDSDESALDPTCTCGHRKSNHNVPGAGPGCYAPRHVCQCRQFTPHDKG